MDSPSELYSRLMNSSGDTLTPAALFSSFLEKLGEDMKDKLSYYSICDDLIEQLKSASKELPNNIKEYSALLDKFLAIADAIHNGTFN